MDWYLREHVGLLQFHLHRFVGDSNISMGGIPPSAAEVDVATLRRQATSLAHDLVESRALVVDLQREMEDVDKKKNKASMKNSKLKLKVEGLRCRLGEASSSRACHAPVRQM